MSVPCTEHGWTWARQIWCYDYDGEVIGTNVQCPTCHYWVWADEADEG